MFNASITKQDRKRKLKDGSVVIQTRYFVNYRDPKTGERRLPSFDRNKDALEFRNKLLAGIENGTFTTTRQTPTVAEAVDHWLGIKQANVQERTYTGYLESAKNVKGPILAGTSLERAAYTRSKKKPTGSALLPLLGKFKVAELTTADIRSWHQIVAAEVSLYTANRAKMLLSAVLALAEEDFGIRTPKMPTQLSRGRNKQKKAILTTEQVRHLLTSARTDKQHGIYYAFPFLAGTRPGEQLALLWEDVDFEANLIRIHRTQGPNAEIIDFTKTEAGMREVPMCSMLREMLLEWRVSCPRHCGNLYRVFPGPGLPRAWPKARVGGGGPLWYQNYRNRIWAPMLKRLGLPHVTPHSARHVFISTLQAQGIEIGLVAKLAGHANPSVTLGHYTQAVRGGEAALSALENAFSA